MYPKAIEAYFAPTTVDEALRLLAEHRDSAKLTWPVAMTIPLGKLCTATCAAASVKERRLPRPSTAMTGI
jgi:hypothetical protein